MNDFLQAQQLTILPENELTDAIRIFVEKEEKDAIKSFVDSSLLATRKSVGNHAQLNQPDSVENLKDLTENEEIFAKEVYRIKEQRVAEYSRIPNRQIQNNSFIKKKDTKMIKNSTKKSSKSVI